MSTKAGTRLQPRAYALYYDSPAKRLVFDFIETFLGVHVIGFQQGSGSIEDQILFDEQKYGSTLCIGISVLLSGDSEKARGVVADKIRAKQLEFEKPSFSESTGAASRG